MAVAQSEQAVKYHYRARHTEAYRELARRTGQGACEGVVGIMERARSGLPYSTCIESTSCGRSGESY